MDWTPAKRPAHAQQPNLNLELKWLWWLWSTSKTMVANNLARQLANTWKVKTNKTRREPNQRHQKTKEPEEGRKETAKRGQTCEGGEGWWSDGRSKRAMVSTRSDQNACWILASIETRAQKLHMPSGGTTWMETDIETTLYPMETMRLRHYLLLRCPFSFCSFHRSTILLLPHTSVLFLPSLSALLRVLLFSGVFGSVPSVFCSSSLFMCLRVALLNYLRP